MAFDREEGTYIHRYTTLTACVVSECYLFCFGGDCSDCFCCCLWLLAGFLAVEFRVGIMSGSMASLVARRPLVPKRFVWPYGGRTVFLCGSFTR